MNGVSPQAYLADVLDRIHDHKMNRLDELLAGTWAPVAIICARPPDADHHLRLHINHVVEMLGEDLKLLKAIVSNSNNLTYGSIISVVHGDDETITALTDDGIDEVNQMLSAAHRSPEAWNEFLHSFVDDEELIARVKANPHGNNRPVTQCRQLFVERAVVVGWSSSQQAWPR